MKPIYLGMDVRLAQGELCHVADVLIDPCDGSERYVVLDVNGFFGPDVVVPVSAIWLVDTCVHMTISAADLASLPHYDATAFCRDTGLRSCACVRHGFHWPHRAGIHYPPTLGAWQNAMIR